MIVHTATFDFVNDDGSEVAAHRHINPDGTVGGWVADTATISPGAIVEVGGIVFPGAILSSGEIVRKGEAKQ